MKIRIIFFALITSLNGLGQLSETISFTYEEGKSKMLKENVRLMAEYYNLDIAEAEIQQKRLWDNPLFVWNAEMYSLAENNYFNFAKASLIRLIASRSVSSEVAYEIRMQSGEPKAAPGTIATNAVSRR